VGDITDHLPADTEALQALVIAARAERDAAIAQREAAIAQCEAAVAERDQALSRMDRLQHLLRQLQRAQFGRRSEKLDPEQLQLAIEDIEQAIASDEVAEDKKDPAGARKRADKRRADRGALPAHLPHVDVTIAPEDTNCPCCRAPMHVIGEETSKRLDVVPAQFRVIVTHRPKYACRACTDGVVQAPAPERLIKGGFPGRPLRVALDQAFSNFAMASIIERRHAPSSITAGNTGSLVPAFSTGTLAAAGRLLS
jgi:transposase